MLNELTKKTSDPAVEQQWIDMKIPELKVLSKAPSFGFGNVLANYSFLAFLQYFGDEARATEGYSLTFSFFEPIVAHDPRYRDFYLFLSGAGSTYAGDPARSVELMDKGLSQLAPNEPPNGYYIWRYKGTDELLFLNDGKSAQKSFEMAAKWAHESSDEAASTVGKVSEQTAQFLADNPASKLAQINAWGSILTTALDDETRKRAITRIQALGGDVVIGGDGQLQIKYAQVEETPGGGKPDS
ncbi:MAG: hypothetical protein DCF15_13575 [Phormidesmis priestleyi]|uniref:Uncharacterized protein n=1 Tax=Phormidesmis priestleyi TaxID=268141 RepID=A0A2W4X6Q1_9CYAN|nr:MAG: hypothetical protein DCF15_13575 [Phormidesmis priestleyi]